MVTAVTNLGRSGLYDWLVQRVSAVIMLAWFLCVTAFMLGNPDMDYEQWRGFFQHTSMRIFSVAAILSLATRRGRIRAPRCITDLGFFLTRPLRVAPDW